MTSFTFLFKKIEKQFDVRREGGNWEATEPYTIIRRFLFELAGMISLDRNYREVILNLLFVLPRLYLNILKIEKIIAILGQKDSRRALEVNHLRWQLIADHNE